MQFEKLTLCSLKVLKSEGYNILTSKNNTEDQRIIWYPDKLIDVNEYLVGIEIIGMPPFYKYRIIVIEDAIKHIKNSDLVGEVFMWI